MPTRAPTTRRPAATKRPATGRFSRPGGAAMQRTATRRTTTASRRPTLARRKPQQSGVQKAIGALTGMLPGAGATKRGRGSGGPGRKGTAGIAVLAGAAGLAMKNREKIGGMLGRRGADTQPLEGRMPETPPQVAPTPDSPAAPVDSAERPPPPM